MGGTENRMYTLDMKPGETVTLSETRAYPCEFKPLEGTVVTDYSAPDCIDVVVC